MWKALGLSALIGAVIAAPASAAERYVVLLKGADVSVVAVDPLAARATKVTDALRVLGIEAATAHRLETVAGFIAPLSASAAQALKGHPSVLSVTASEELAVSVSAPIAGAPGIHIVAGPGATAPCFASGSDVLCGGGGVFDAGRGRISMGSWTSNNKLIAETADALRALDWVAARAIEGSPDAPSGTQVTLHADVDICADPTARAIASAGASAGLVVSTAAGAVPCLAGAERRAAVTISVSPTTTRIIEGKVGGPYTPSSFNYTVKASTKTQRFVITGGQPWLPITTTARTATVAGLAVPARISLTGANARSVGVHKMTLRFQNQAVPTNFALRPIVLNKFGSKTAGAVVFSRYCAVCHGINDNKTGPRLTGFYNRRAGTAVGYVRYSAALRAYGRVWTYENLLAYLTTPQTVVPGTRMPAYGYLPATDRHNLVAFLRSLSPGSP